MTIVAQVSTDVKSDDYIFGDPPSGYLAEESNGCDLECSYDDCHEPVFRDSGLCLGHFVEEETAKWDALQAERETCLAGVGR